MGSIEVHRTTESAASSLTKKTALTKTADLNVKHVVLGDILFKTWYPSFYPEELVGRELERLYVCPCCFKYTKDLVPYLAHKKLCPQSSGTVPGRLIYVKDGLSIYEVDGEEHQLFCQSLSLFAKLFLDNKSVFFDVACFDYYILVQDVPTNHPHRTRHQIVGFFSKEKMSWDNNNLACILVFPPWQRRGFGKILMGISYKLSEREGQLGGPEKPLSELGRVGYIRFWGARIAKAILEMKNKKSFSVQELSDRCSMLPEDVITTLQDMALNTNTPPNGNVVINKARVRDWICVNKVDLNPPVDEESFLEGYLAEYRVD